MSEIGGCVNLAKGALQNTTEFPLTHISPLHNSINHNYYKVPMVCMTMLGTLVSSEVCL